MSSAHSFQRYRDLRRELADAIADRDAADAKVGAAKHAHDRADRALQDARAAVERLKAGFEATQKAATETRVKAIAEAIRAGKPAPVVPLSPAQDSAPLAEATDQFHALELVTGELSGELALARDSATKAANTVNAIVEAILEGEAHVLAQELIERRPSLARAARGREVEDQPAHARRRREWALPRRAQLAWLKKSRRCYQASFARPRRFPARPVALLA